MFSVDMIHSLFIRNSMKQPFYFFDTDNELSFLERNAFRFPHKKNLGKFFKTLR